MAEAPGTSPPPESSPATTGRRPTGSIPQSWVRPAEDVSVAPLPRPRAAPLVLVAVLAVAVVAFGVWVLRPPTASPPPVLSPPPPHPAPRPISAVEEPSRPDAARAPEDDDRVTADPSSAPSTPTPAAHVAEPAERDASTAVDEAAKKRARVLVQRAQRAARDGNEVQARALAEEAVATDPDCAPCWRTLGLLRARAGDSAGAAVARARAATLSTPTAPTAR